MKAFVDPDAAERAATDLAPVFWELYLAFSLKTAGIELIPRARRTPARKGPDLFAQSPPVWLEAVMPTSGDGPDELPAPSPGEASYAPTDTYVLRLRSAIEAKAERTIAYMRNGIIKKGQASIIAVSGARLRWRLREPPVPRIVRATLGVGDLVLHIDRNTRAIVEHSAEYRDQIKKSVGAPVKTDLFLHDGYAHISAVMYSSSHWVPPSETPGEDFIVVHNPHASTPLPRGWLPVGDEYWLEDGFVLQRKQHSSGAADRRAAHVSVAYREIVRAARG